MIGFAFGQHALRGQLVGVQLARAGVMADALVHQGLRQRRGVLFVVAQLAEANDVHDDVVTELQAVVQGQLGDEHHGFGVVAVDVEHRGFNHLDHVGAIQRRTRVTRVGRGEADLVVDDDVQRAARAVAAGLGQVQRFHHHALAGESRVAVHQHRQHGLAFGVAAAFLASAHAAFDHGVDDFKVGRVERQRQVDRAATGGQVGGEAVVVLHVAVGQAFGVFAFELGEQVAGHLAHDVHKQVQATAVGHADHDFLDAVFTGVVHHFVHRGDEAFAAFQREALLADVLGVQVALEAFGGGQALQRTALGVSVQLVVATGQFQLLVDPLALLDLGDVHELRTDRTGVGRLQARQQVTQLHARLTAHAAGAELAVEVSIGQVVEGQAQVRGVDRSGQAQRVQAGVQMTTRTVGGDQATDIALALIACTGAGACFQRILGRVRDVGNDGRVRNVACFAALEAVEVGFPFGIDTIRGDQVLLVQVLDIGGVAAGELRRLRKLLQLIVHDGGC
ncbi:hypothetical protein D3C73_691460 [compost metagenome]